MLWSMAALAAIAALTTRGVLWMTSVPGASYEGPLSPLTPDQTQLAARLREHVAEVATRPHSTGYPDELEQAAAYIERGLAATGYAVHRQPLRADDQEVRNLEVVIEPAASARNAPADTPDKVDYERLARVVSGLEQIIRGWAQAPFKPILVPNFSESSGNNVS